MPYEPPPEIGTLSLEEIAGLIAERKLPPVSQWNPARTGDSEMEITADGRWFHQGGEIKRPAMIRAFSTLLRRDTDGGYWLVTPAERLSIKVEDAPFLAVELRNAGDGKDRNIAFRLNVDDLLIADAEHPLVMRTPAKGHGEARPYILVRDNLWARLTRPVYYELAELALSESPESPGLWSCGSYFSLEHAA